MPSDIYLCYNVEQIFWGKQKNSLQIQEQDSSKIRLKFGPRGQQHGKKEIKKSASKNRDKRLFFQVWEKTEPLIRPGAKQRMFLLLRKMSCLAAVVSAAGRQKKPFAIKKYHTPTWLFDGKKE